VVDLDPATVAVPRAWKRQRGALALQLVRNDAVVFGEHEGAFRHPERFSHLFREAQVRCARVLGDDAPPVIRVHDLRHTHATILLRDRENVKVVSERPGHANVSVTLTTYSHVCRAISDRPRLVLRLSWRERKHDRDPLVAARYHGLVPCLAQPPGEAVTCAASEGPQQPSQNRKHSDDSVRSGLFGAEPAPRLG
jgi:Phage integrase family